jgi:putative membrane protein
MMYHDNYWNMFGMWMIWLPIVVICVFLLSRFLNNSNKSNTFERETPLDILKKRYANGEISTEEYEERKKALADN